MHLILEREYEKISYTSPLRTSTLNKENADLQLLYSTSQLTINVFLYSSCACMCLFVSFYCKLRKK